MRRRLLALAFLPFVSAPAVPQAPRERPAPSLPTPPTVVPDAPEAATPPEEASNPYEGWSTWCDQEWDWACEDDGDCAGMTDPVGHPLFCGRPRWARGNEDVTAKVCRPGAFGLSRRRSEKKRLRVFVDAVCHPPDWYEPGTECWQYKWKKARECKQANWCDPDKLAAFLGLIALRESTWKPYVRHHLNPDIHANETAWGNRDEDYGWDIAIDEYGNIASAKRLRPDANDHYPEMGRWSTGVGWYGQNAPIYVQEWDVEAPPEILCREVEASESYLRVTRRVWKKVRSGLDCDQDGEREFFGSATLNGEPWPSLADVHQGASGGKICPRANFHERFVRRAKRAKLNAYEPIMLEQLGEPIPKATQNEMAAEIRAAMKL